MPRRARAMLRRLRGFFRQRSLETEMNAELRAHLEGLIERNLATGMSADEARFAALRTFGGVEQIKERARDERRSPWLENFFQDVRHAARALRKAPGFTLTVVVTLAVGIGLMTALVNVAQPILLPSVPFPDAGRLVILREKMPPERGGYALLLPHRFASYAEHSTSFVNMGSERRELMNLVVAAEPHPVRASLVTEGFFGALGVGCREGRLFQPEDYTAAHAGDAVVLSHAAWRRFFAADPALIGRDIQVGDRLRRVLGILPPEFTTLHLWGETDGIYLAAPIERAPTPGRSLPVYVVGRMKSGITVAQAEAELGTIKPEAAPGSGGDFYRNLKPWLIRAADAFRENRAAPFRVFVGAAALLHLIGCTAVANLMLSRAVARRRELGVRLALGGSRRRIVALMLIEALLLAVGGALGGTLVAGGAQQLMTHLAPPGVSADELLRHAVLGRTFGVAFVLAVLTCGVSALVPALRASRVSLNEALKERAGTLGDSPRLRFLRGTFVVVQGALAVALLIGTGLLLKTVHRLAQIDLGFVPERKVVVTGTRAGAVNREHLSVLNTSVLEAIARVPGVKTAAVTTTTPGGGGMMSISSFKLERNGVLEEVPAHLFSVSPDYFSVMEMPLVAGPGFAGLHPGDRPVAVIDERTAREYFPKGDAVGRQIIRDKEPLEIVGVVRAVAIGWRGESAAKTRDKAVTAQLYTPTWQSRPSALSVNIVVRVREDAGPELGAALRRAAFAADPTLVLNLQSLDEVIGNWSLQQRQTLAMLQILAGLALGLTAFGMFSVMAYAVAQRRSELGLRLVLGATPAGVMRFVLGRGLRLGALGIVIGLAIAAACSRFLSAILYQTSTHEPLVFVAVAVVLFAVTALACWLPARRAASIDPVEALRAE